MAVIVNNPAPAPSSDSGGSVGMIIGIIVLFVMGYLFFMYGLPTIRQIGSPQINIPDKIDVNVTQTK